MLTDLYSKALLDLLFENSEDFLGIYDLGDKRYVRVNRAGIHMLGFSSELEFLLDPLRARTLRNQLLEEDHTSLIEKILEEGQHEETTRISKKDGQTFWGKLTIRTFQVQEQPFALIKLVDQERLHQAERELEHTVLRDRAIFSNATIGIIVCDEPGHIVSANKMAEQLLGYGPGELLTMTVEQLVPLGMSHYHQKLRQSYIANPQVRAMGHNRDLYAQRKDGSVFPVEISLSYFRLDGEQFAVAYIIDITLKKETEQQLLDHRDSIERLNQELEQKIADRTQALLQTLDQFQQSKDELARALAAERELGEMKSRFVSLASHEFRTPLTTVLNSASLIEKYTESDQQDKRVKNLQRIRTSVKHLNDILEEFLSVGKLEEGKITAHPIEVDLARLVEEAIAEVQGLLKPGQTVLPIVTCPHPVWLDGSLLRKILVNLLSNAVKYSGPGSTVRLHGECNEMRLIVQVEDQGVGIAPEDQQHLFERFYRAKNAAHIPGTGLGLHIVARYVELMQGTIALESNLHQGTSLTLTIPYENHSAD